MARGDWSDDTTHSIKRPFQRVNTYSGEYGLAALGWLQYWQKDLNCGEGLSKGMISWSLCNNEVDRRSPSKKSILGWVAERGSVYVCCISL